MVNQEDKVALIMDKLGNAVKRVMIIHSCNKLQM